MEKHDDNPAKRVRREVCTSLKTGAKMGWKIKIDFENCDCQLPTRRYRFPGNPQSD